MVRTERLLLSAMTTLNLDAALPRTPRVLPMLSA
jgi:hypothetical protein